MNCEELLIEQIQMTTNASPGTTTWIYRNAIKVCFLFLILYYDDAWTKELAVINWERENGFLINFFFHFRHFHGILLYAIKLLILLTRPGSSNLDRQL
jgi:hypothetical protein